LLSKARSFFFSPLLLSQEEVVEEKSGFTAHFSFVFSFPFLSFFPFLGEGENPFSFLFPFSFLKKKKGRKEEGERKKIFALSRKKKICNDTHKPENP